MRAIREGFQNQCATHCGIRMVMLSAVIDSSQRLIIWFI